MNCSCLEYNSTYLLPCDLGSWKQWLHQPRAHSSNDFLIPWSLFHWILLPRSTTSYIISSQFIWGTKSNHKLWLVRIYCVYLQLLFAKYCWFESFIQIISFRFYLKPRPAEKYNSCSECFENANDDSATLSKRAYWIHPENVRKISDSVNSVRRRQSTNCIKYCSSLTWISLVLEPVYCFQMIIIIFLVPSQP